MARVTEITAGRCAEVVGVRLRSTTPWTSHHEEADAHAQANQLTDEEGPGNLPDDEPIQQGHRNAEECNGNEGLEEIPHHFTLQTGLPPTNAAVSACPGLDPTVEL